MREIPLSRGLVTTVDDADYDAVISLGKWCALSSTYTFYAVRSARRADGRKTTIALHTVLTGWPLVDHVDGDGLNNTRANLRPATKAQNACNARIRSDNTTGYRGVSFRKDGGKWRAQITVDGRNIDLGRYVSPEEAARAYDTAAREKHGPFATLNFPATTS